MDFFEQQRQDADPTFDEGRRSSARSSAARSAGRSSRDKLFFFGALEKFRERSNNVAHAGGVQPAAAPFPARRSSSAIPTPYDDTLLTAEGRLAAIGANQTLFARFAYQDQSSPNDQIPVPATADLNNGNTNTTTQLRLRGQPHVDAVGRTG